MPEDPWHGISLPGKVEVSRWAELLDYEAGLLEPRTIELYVPGDVSATAARVAEEVRLLLGLRSEKWRDTTEFTFSRRMCRARCRLSEARARAALYELRQRRILIQIGLAGRALVYRLGRPEEVVRRGPVEPGMGGGQDA